MSLSLTVGDMILGIEDYMHWTANFNLVWTMQRINTGYRRFLRGQYVDYDGTQQCHSWSFMRPQGSLTIWATVTGTIVGSPSYNAGTGVTTITATTAKFYVSMIGQNFTFDTSGVSYPIASYTSATSIKLTGDASGELAGDTFTVTATGVYALPTDFAGTIKGENPVYVNDGYPTCDLEEVDSQYMDVKTRKEPITGIPELWCAEVRNVTPGQLDQTWNMKFWPIPDRTRVIQHRYRRTAEVLSSSATTMYPMGGVDHCDTILALALADAEAETGKSPGAKAKAAQAAMQRSVALDEAEFEPNGDPDQIGVE